MQEVEFSKGNEDDAGTYVNGFLNQIIDGGKFYGNFFPSMLKFDFRGEFHPVADISVNEGYEVMLVEFAGPLIFPVKIFDVHVAADDGLGGGDEWTGIDQAA